MGLQLFGQKVKSLQAVKAIAKIFIYLDRVVSVRKNIKKSLFGNEIESSENLSLLTEIFGQGFLT